MIEANGSVSASPTSCLIIGHRGTGKSAFLERVRAYAGGRVDTYDLDREVEATVGRAVDRIFSEFGEARFRELEREVLAKLVARAHTAKRPVWVAAGAGFDGDVPSGWRSLWLSRGTDSGGRIFLDRPRLNPTLAPLVEFESRRLQRAERFARLATDRLELDEGFDEPSSEEREFVLGALTGIGGALTVGASDFRNGVLAPRLLERLRQGIGHLEFRDDLLPRAVFEDAARTIPRQQLLLSCRDPQRTSATVALARALGCALDWASELGPIPGAAPVTIVSFHEPMSGESLSSLLQRADDCTEAGLVAKVSPLVESMAELQAGDLWRRRDPKHRAFLPRSADGRWAWYRLATKGAQPIQFWREGPGSAPDQPSLLRWLRARGVEAAGFAAVLGHPVIHSRTPAEQRCFSEPRRLDLYAIDVSPDEWDAGALEVLRELGLRYAAVTAPLKELAFEVCASVDDVAGQARAVNSLALGTDGRWAGANTDLAGLQRAWLEAAADLAPDAVAIWGGGGTLEVARRVLGPARAYSARTGRPRENVGIGRAEWRPAAVLWAVGRSRMHDSQWPPDDWAPRLVVDMNYSDDSPGREYALRTGARYVSGLAMFKAQAELQRAFWERNGTL